MRKLGLVIAVLVLLTVMAIPAVGRSQQPGQAGNSNIVQVDLHGPSGTMHYNLSGCTLDAVFNGHGLEPGQEYVLRFGPHGGDWLELGSGTANEGGNVHIIASVDPSDTWSVPNSKTWQNKRVRLGYWQTATTFTAVLTAEGRYSFTYDCPE
jgi:hypothetical protein